MSAALQHKTSYIPEVDGLRAVAAMAVIAFHSAIFPFGWAGVWLFFVISGFVITRGVMVREWRLSSASYRDFFVSRARRIWPLYFLFLAVGTLVTTALIGQASLWNGPPGWAEMLSLITFTENIGRAAGVSSARGMDHLWSISTEQQFYLVFPFLVALMMRFGPLRTLVPVIVLALAVRIGLVAGLLSADTDPEAAAHVVYLFSLGHFDAFAGGMLLAVFADRLHSARVRQVLYGVATVAVACFLGRAMLDPKLSAAVARHSLPGVDEALRPYTGSSPTDPVAMALIFVPLVLGSVALMSTAISGQGYLAAALRWEPLVYVGQISFGVYIWHRIPSKICDALMGVPDIHPAMGPRLISMVATMATSIALASLSYRYFESRFHRRIGIAAPAAAMPMTRIVHVSSRGEGQAAMAVEPRPNLD